MHRRAWGSKLGQQHTDIGHSLEAVAVEVAVGWIGGRSEVELRDRQIGQADCAVEILRTTIAGAPIMDEPRDHRHPREREREYRFLARAVWGLSVLVSALVLTLNIRPGLIASKLLELMMMACVLLPVAAIVGAALLWQLYRRRNDPKLAGLLLRSALAVFVCGLVTVIGVGARIPQRIAFAFARLAFEKLVESAPPSERGVALRREIGSYYVDKYAADPRGGVYFRVGTGPAGIGPDRTSYGFAHRPNPSGTPFGAASCTVHRLTGDWYVFEASDDFY